MKKIIALFLVFSLLVLSGNLYAKRKGAALVVQKKDGWYERGELIAVKKDILLLLDSVGADVSVEIKDVKVITFVRKSHVTTGALAGLLVGGAVGALIGASGSDSKDGDNGFLTDFNLFSEGQLALMGAVILGGLGALIGAGIGAAAGTDKTIQIEGKSDSEIKVILENLRKKARVRNFQ